MTEKVEKKATNPVRQESILRLKKYITNKKNLTQIEKSIMEYTLINAQQSGMWKSWENPIFVDLYISKLRCILNNLDPSGTVKNTYLLPAIHSNKIDLTRLAFMEPVELFPDRSKALIDKFKEQEHTLHYHKPVTSKAYTCGKCKKSTCLVQQYQSRSCDESATTSISCLYCGNRWVHNG
jgi:DNA-directed RNA polymerase subunit M/transcription elongation factor TFIIS